MRRALISSFSLLAVFAAVAASPAAAADKKKEKAASKQPWKEPAAGAAAPAVQVPPQTSLAPLIKALKPTVVNISTTTVVKNPHGGGGPQPQRPDMPEPYREFFERYFGQQPPQMPEEFRGASLGSGFVINGDGFILTNNHVVKDASDIRVRLWDNREFEAKVVGRDPQTDVAVIKLENPPKDLTAATLGDSDALEQGDFVLAMGNPLGLRESATFGMVSAKDRAIGAGTYDDFIQTDAAINPGNSGGPLYNLKGEVVGINTAIVSPQIGQGIGFAVPINMAKQLLPQLIEKGRVARGYLGVTVSELTHELAAAFGLPPGTKGAVVQHVLPKAPAGKAGVEAGDVVISLNGKPIESSGQLTRGVAVVPPGSDAKLTILRNGEKKDLTVKVAQRPDDEEALARGEIPGEEGPAATDQPAEKLGIKVQDLDPRMARELKLEGDEGVVVTAIDPDGTAARAGVQRGDLIIELNRQPVRAPEEMSKILEKAKPGDMALLRIRRGNGALFVPVRVQGPKK